MISIRVHFIAINFFVGIHKRTFVLLNKIYFLIYYWMHFDILYRCQKIISLGNELNIFKYFLN